MSGSAAASKEEFAELVYAEQYVDLPKLRDLARHGIQPIARGEVWLYLLGVLLDDKSQEQSAVRSKYLEYKSLDKHNDLYEKRIRHEATRYYQRKLVPRPPPGRKSGRPFHRISLRGAQLADPPKARDGSDEDAQAYRKGMQAADLDNLMSGRASDATVRGPNRVDNGQQRVLAGIMGGSLSLGIPANSTQTSEDDTVLLDPEAASANEMKRFCLAMENIICAHLNRWRWRTLGGASGLLPVTQQPSNSASNGDGEADTSSGMSAEDTSSAADNAHSNAQVVNVAETLSTLPKEYEWAHEPAEIPRGINASSFPDGKNGDAAGTPAIDELRQLYKPEYHPDLIILCAPFVMCIQSEAGIYFAFERLMSLVEQYNVRHPLPARIATFLTLFRTTLPDLYAYFDEEEVDVIGLASAWLRHLLAAEMRIEDLMRLWDTYFAVPDPLDLHMYVCLAILTNCKDALEELDQSEAKSMLFSLPPLDVDRIINEAINIRLAHRQSELLGTTDDDSAEQVEEAGEEGSDGDGEDVIDSVEKSDEDSQAKGPVDVLEEKIRNIEDRRGNLPPIPTQT